MSNIQIPPLCTLNSVLHWVSCLLKHKKCFLCPNQVNCKQHFLRLILASIYLCPTSKRLLWYHYVWSSHTYARRCCNASALFVLHSHSVTSQLVVLWYQKRIYVVPLPVFHCIWLPAIQLPETSSYWTFSSSLTEWSRDKLDHSVNKLFVHFSGYHSVNELNPGNWIVISHLWIIGPFS